MVSLEVLEEENKGVSEIHVRKNYWWLICRDSEGKPYLVFGSERSEDDARQKGIEMNLGDFGDFEIKRFPTRDKGEASAYYRGKRLERGDGIDAAKQRIGHEKSIDQLRRRANKRRRTTGNDY